MSPTRTLHFLIQFCSALVSVRAGHYKVYRYLFLNPDQWESSLFCLGGSITWKPVDPTTNTSMVDIIIYQTHSWTWTRLQCNQSVIDDLGWYTDYGGAFSGEPFVMCQVAPSVCTSVNFATIRERTYCTDFSRTLDLSSGALIKKITLDRTANIIVGFNSTAWAPVIKTNTNLSASTWKVLTRIDLTKTYPINSSPGSLSAFHS